MTVPAALDPKPAAGGRRVLLGTVSSDAHTWNLVFLQLVLEEAGHQVINLGACVPVELFVTVCLDRRPDLVVVSSVNGHGFADGKLLAAALRREPALADIPVVIGGKLGVDGSLTGAQVGELLAAGFNAVFDDGVGRERFLEYVHRLELVGAGRPE